MPPKRKLSFEQYARRFGDELLTKLFDHLVNDGMEREVLPPHPPRRQGKPSLYALLYVAEGAPLDVCEAAYRALAKRAHPDAGGNPATFRKLTTAIEMLRKTRQR